MKTMNKRSTYPASSYPWLLLLLLGLTAGGCIYDAYPGEESAKAEEPVPVTIRLFTRFGGEEKRADTRGLSDVDEGQVNDAYIFFLRVSDNTVHSVVKGKDVTNTSTTEKTFTANLEVTGSAGQQFRCIVLANASSLLDKKSLKVYEGKTYGDIQQMLVSDPAYTSAPVLAAGGFVMWGEAKTLIVADRHPQKITVHMLRAVARLDIGVGINPVKWDGTDADNRVIPFKLKKVFIFKPNNACAFMPLAGAYDAEAQRVTLPSPAGGVVYTTRFEYDVQPAGATSLTAAIYLPEANVLHPEGGVPVATPQPGDLNHTKRCAIVVGGSYKGNADSYYRIDFRNGTVLADLLRNHRYQASITSVTGNGEATPEEAYESNRINISATVLGWNDWSQDVVFDGVDHVYVEKKSILLPGNAGLTGAIAVESNVDPAEWQMSLDGVNYPTATVISNADFEVAKPAVKEGGNLLIRTRNRLADGAQPKTAMLTVKIHRLRFTISIEQRPDTPEDWVDGGEFPKDF